MPEKSGAYLKIEDAANIYVSNAKYFNQRIIYKVFLNAGFRNQLV